MTYYVAAHVWYGIESTTVCLNTCSIESTVHSFTHQQHSVACRPVDNVLIKAGDTDNRLQLATVRSCSSWLHSVTVAVMQDIEVYVSHIESNRPHQSQKSRCVPISRGVSKGGRGNASPTFLAEGKAKISPLFDHKMKKITGCYE